MNEKEAREILGDIIQDDDKLDSERSAQIYYISWEADGNGVGLDGWYSTDELEAIIWWMKN